MAYIGNGRTLLVLGSNVRDDIVPDNTSTTFNLSQEVPGGYEGNVYVFKQTYITENLITGVVGNDANAGINFATQTSTFTITTDNDAIAAALSDIKETAKLYSDLNHTITISGSSNGNNGTFTIVSCSYNGSTLTITLAKPGAQGTPDTGSISLNRGYSGFWEILEPDIDYTIGGAGSNINKQITFSKVPKLNDKIYVIHKGDATYNLVPSDNSVGPNQLSTNLRDFSKQSVVATAGQTTIQLTQDSINSKAILVTVDGIVQEGEEWNGISVSTNSDYALNTSVSPNTIIFRTALTVGQKVRILHLGFSTVSRRSVLSPGQSGPVAPGSITATELATSSVLENKIAASAVTNSKLAADSITADKILLNNNTSLRSYRANGTTVFSALTLNSSDELIVNTPTTAHISISGTKTVNISSTQIVPEATDVIALGSTTKKFTDAHLSGQLNSQTANVTGNITVGGTVDGVDVSVLNTTVSNLQTLVNNLVPIGTMMVWSHATVPNSNWLVCDGSAISRTTYSSLFALISTSYGSGDGSTTFNLPDMRRRVAIGASAGLTVASSDNLAEGSRNLSHTHSVPAHSHGLSNHTHSVPPHFHGMGTGADLNITSSGSHTTTIDISHSHTANGGSGNSGPSGTLTTNNSTTNISFAISPHSHGGVTAYSDPNHSHTMNSAGEHRHTLRQETSGSGTFNAININSASLGSGLNTTNSNMGLAGNHTHTINGTSINHRHDISSETVGYTWTEPNAGQGHGHTIPTHTHTVSIDPLGVTNKFDNGGSHTHAFTAFSGSIGLGLSGGGVNGNATMTSDTPNTNTSDNSAVLTTGSTNNFPYLAVNYIIRAL